MATSSTRSTPGTEVTSQPTWLVEEATTRHVLADGGRLLVRPLLPTDREALAAAYEHLSPVAKHLRFFSAPDHLSEREIDYLTELDYDRHFALTAFMEDEPGVPGVGVARYIRIPGDDGCAEAAVTVVDDHQGRGIGTILTVRLAEEALARGVTTFVTYVLWDNRATISGLQAGGARVLPAEPGVARVEAALPALLERAGVAPPTGQGTSGAGRSVRPINH